ncbi:MAG TPA: zinc-binding dehydrogenase [Actinomycetota bacterium]|nr:zinc-binding dehydrogenase [Actinomycetota bacterium]
MIALQFRRSPARYVAARALSRRAPGLVASHLAPLRLGHVGEPELPADGWVRVAPKLAGICGSDLAMVAGDASFYFGPLVSTPFVPGHEVVGTLVDPLDDLPSGTRVVIEPVLGCAARGLDPACRACAAGDTGCCENTASGHVAPGLQTGFCEDTGGGWGEVLVAHRSQIRPIPDDLPDESAVLVEPLACAVHAALRARVADGDTVVVMGAGTIGLLTLAAIREFSSPGRVIAVAKHPRQRAEAARLGADDVVAAPSALRAVRLATGSLLHEPERGGGWLSSGSDVSLECTGSMAALDVCLRTTRPRGRVVLVGLPGAATIDLAPVWHRELELTGAYTYGAEQQNGTRRNTFDMAIELAAKLDLESLVSAAYPLSRYPEAIDHAMDAGRLGAVKVVFDIAR